MPRRTTAAKRYAAWRNPQGQHRFSQDSRHRTARMEQCQTIVERSGMHIFARSDRLGQLRWIPKQMCAGSQLGHSHDHAAAGAGSERNFDGLWMEQRGD